MRRQLQLILLLVLFWCILPTSCTALSPPVVSPFVPLLMASVPDPFLHATVGTLASGLGTLAAFPLEALLLKEGAEDKPANDTDSIFLTLQQGFQLGTYTAILATIQEPILLAMGRIISAIVVGGSSGIVKAFQWDNTLEVLQVCMAKEGLFLVLCLPMYHALVLDGMQPFAAGALSGILACLLTSPFRTLEQRMCRDPLFTKLEQEMHHNFHGSDRKAQPQNTKVTTIVVDGKPLILPKVLPLPPPAKPPANNSSLFYKKEPTSETTESTDTEENKGSWSDSVPIEGDEMTEAEAKRTLEEIIASWDEKEETLKPESTKTTQDQKNTGLARRNDNGNLVFLIVSIAEHEGYGVLMDGALEGCALAIPKFGTMLSMYDQLQDTMYQAGWISQQNLHL